MRINIDIDDELIHSAQQLTQLESQSDVIAYALRELLLLDEQAKIREFRGKLQWEGDLDYMRTDK